MKQKIKSVDVVTSRFRNSLFFGGILLIFSMRYRYNVKKLLLGWDNISGFTFTDYLMTALQLMGIIMIISSVVFYILKKINDRKIEKIKRKDTSQRCRSGKL